MSEIKRNLSAALLEVAELYPDWRFGQLVENVAAWADVDEPGNAYEASDADLLRAAREHLASKHITAERPNA